MDLRFFTYFWTSKKTYKFAYIRQVVDPALSAEEKKLAFVSIWFSFAFALYLLNRWRIMMHNEYYNDSLSYILPCPEKTSG